VDKSLEALLLLVGERSAPVIALQGTEHALVRPGPPGGAARWWCARLVLHQDLASWCRASGVCHHLRGLPTL
jgi:hypothetical protein